MAVRKITPKAPARRRPDSSAAGSGERYRRLPTGTHGLDPELVKLDQRRRLREAMVELIAASGYPAVRISDLAKLAHVSAPTFYGLYAGKEDLFRDAYEEIASRIATTVLTAYGADRPGDERLSAALGAFAELAAGEPEAVSLLVLGAFGAGREALERRRASMAALEHSIEESRDGKRRRGTGDGDLTVKAIIGGIREVTATRLRDGRHEELVRLAPQLAGWAGCYPRRLPGGLAAPAPAPGECTGGATPSERAKRAEGRLPSGRSELPRKSIVKSQRERIVDATAAIVAEKGLQALTIPEIARRANISNQTFYSIYHSKRDAFLGAQKVGLHQALQVTGQAYEAQGSDWPRAVAAGLGALLCYLASEPAHAHLTLVDTFGTIPQAMEIRGPALAAFSSYLQPGYDLAGEETAVPDLAAEAIAGGIWQILHHYVDHGWAEALPGLAPQLTFFALVPFLGVDRALAGARCVSASATPGE